MSSLSNEKFTQLKRDFQYKNEGFLLSSRAKEFALSVVEREGSALTITRISRIRVICEACPERSRMDPWFKIGKNFLQFSIKNADTLEQKSNFLKNF